MVLHRIVYLRRQIPAGGVHSSVTVRDRAVSSTCLLGFLDVQVSLDYFDTEEKFTHNDCWEVVQPLCLDFWSFAVDEQQRWWCHQDVSVALNQINMCFMSAFSCDCRARLFMEAAATCLCVVSLLQRHLLAEFTEIRSREKQKFWLNEEILEVKNDQICWSTLQLRSNTHRSSL